MNRNQFILALIILLVPPNKLFADPPIFKEIDAKNVVAIELFLKTNDINEKYGEDSLTLLTYAISKNNRKVVKFLLKAGADPNVIDFQQNSPLMYAAKTGDLKMIKLLLRNGAWLNYNNEEWLTAYDVAVRAHYPEASRYLKSRYERDLPPFRDGPYVAWKNGDRINAFYLVHDSARNHTEKIKKKFSVDEHPFHMPGFAYDTISYSLNKTHPVNPSRYTDVSKLLIIGDIHGGYDSLILFLINNGVVDDQLKWTFGKGHIVFLGDIFDRGDKVTESLWFIYQLEQQALKSGGFVHFILGNHEVMILLKDHRFITDKYYYLCKKLQLTYGQLFAKKTVLGNWLRSKNSIIIIDDKLFVHAGISSEIINQNLTVEELNDRVRYFLMYPERNRRYGLENREIIMGMKGPFWYRGFIETDDYYPRFTGNDLDAILDHYNVLSVFIGHSNVDTVSALYDNRVIMLDVPFYNYGISMQALLIEENLKYLLTTSGNRKTILKKWPMFTKNHFMILIFLGTQLAGIAQDDTISQSEYIPPPLFESNEPIEIILAFDVPTVIKDIGDDRKYHDAFLSYLDMNGDTIQLQIRIRTRGNFRRDPNNCNFPPLRFDFSDAALENTVFERQARLKLVTHCNARKKYYEKYLLKEYLIYRLYNIIAEESYRVRLIRATYVDISGRREPLEKYGFFLETSGKMAARNECEEYDIENVKQNDIQDDIMVKLSMFQFMIGNTDWSVQALHNIELIKPAPYLPPIAVPYDFDWSGLVNTNYSFPAPNLEIQSVTERLYRGICRTNQEYQDAIQIFIEKEQEIYSFCNNFTYLEEKERKQIVRYIEQFYFILDNPRLAYSEIYSKCRTK